MRPALYQAYHRIFSVKENRKEQETIYDVVGPICESSDFLGKERSLKEIKEGDSLVISEAGAYGRSMASQYNAHEYPDELVFYQGKPI